MKIVIDLQAAQAENRLRGIGRYSFSLCKAMIEQPSPHEFILLLNGLFSESIEPIRQQFSKLLNAEQIVIWHAPGPLASCNPDADWQRAVAVQIREACICNLKPDFVLIMSWFEGFGDDALTTLPKDQSAYLVGSVLYDLIPLLNAKEYLEGNSTFKSYYLKKVDQLTKFNLLLAISESSMREAIQELGVSPSSICNISSAVEGHFEKVPLSPLQQNRLLNHLGITKPFVMYTGGIDKRKNIEGLIKAYALLPKHLHAHYQLVVVCGMNEDDRLRLKLLAKNLGLSTDDLILTGYVSEADLLMLYNACYLFAFPSLHEGFGMPVLEALACGCAVICSNSSSLPEVVNCPQALFDPRSEQSISQKLEEALTDPQVYANLKEHSLEQAGNFSWKKSADYALRAIEECFLQSKSKEGDGTKSMSVVTLQKPRLAFVSPLPPERSGISDYSAELLPELAAHYEIDVIVAQKEVTDSWVNAYCTVHPAEWFLEHAREYERVIYHFGNSTFHEHMFALLRQVPGVVVLHDFYLSGIVAHREVHSGETNAWNRELYHSHGYHAVQERYAAGDTADIVWKYPCNLSVIQYAIGVIVHSAHSLSLFSQWYGKQAAQDCHVIPLLRVPFDLEDRANLRTSLRLSKDDFVVCSFGVLGKSKLNHRLIQAWLSSSLAADPHCILIFVGDYSSFEYELLIKKTIAQGICADRIRIMGWTSAQVFKEYLGVADLAVQLRATSRGETSAAVLDCFNASLPTIINRHGSLADLPSNTCYQLPDEFSDAQLIHALEMLWVDQSARQNLASQAKAYLNTDHMPVACAMQYQEAIEQMYAPKTMQMDALIKGLAEVLPAVSTKEIINQIADSVAKTLPPPYRVKQILVDISELVQRDSRSGIQRVVRSILKEWLQNPPVGYRIEPVYATVDQGYRYARHFTLGFLDCPKTILQDDWVEFYPGDHFVGLDLQPHVVISKEGFYQTLRQAGVSVQFVVYDLLPVLMPQFFVEGAKPLYQSWLSVVAQSHGVLCISKAVSEQFKGWQESQADPLIYRAQSDWFHLGADVQSSVPSIGIPEGSAQLLKDLKEDATFMMVGTLEPRKGHRQVLDAFECLWKRGHQVNLIIVGKQGWMVEDLVEKIASHPRLNLQLFWLEAISDEYLELLYAKCQCLIAASEGEGFGLPLIEAAMHDLPIIARDLAVFREVASTHAFYFSGNDPIDLANAIEQWLAVFGQDTHPKSTLLEWQSWRQSAQRLLDLVIKT